MLSRQIRALKKYSDYKFFMIVSLFTTLICLDLAK